MPSPSRLHRVGGSRGDPKKDDLTRDEGSKETRLVWTGWDAQPLGGPWSGFVSATQLSGRSATR